MPVWATASVENVPEIRLASWRVFESNLGERHLVGYNLTLREGRVTSQVTSFDAKQKRAVTESGRVYELVGQAGWNSDADYVWNVWKSHQADRTYTEITEDVQAEIAAAGEE